MGSKNAIASAMATAIMMQTRVLLLVINGLAGVTAFVRGQDAGARLPCAYGVGSHRIPLAPRIRGCEMTG